MEKLKIFKYKNNEIPDIKVVLHNGKYHMVAKDLLEAMEVDYKKNLRSYLEKRLKKEKVITIPTSNMKELSSSRAIIIDAESVHEIFKSQIKKEITDDGKPMLYGVSSKLGLWLIETIIPYMENPDTDKVVEIEVERVKESDVEVIDRDEVEKFEIAEVKQDKVEILDTREVLGRNFRVFGTIEEPLFMAKDVAEWIDYAKTGNGSYDVSKMLTTVDDREKLIRTTFVSGQNRGIWFLTEHGLYEVLMQSRKPIAKAFKDEVKAILKEIRLKGSYSKNNNFQDQIPKTLSEALIRAGEYLQEVETLKVENETLKDKAIYNDRVLENNEVFPISFIAREFGMSGRGLNKFLEYKGIQRKDKNNRWDICKEYERYGYVDYREYPLTGYYQMVWTQEGREFLHKFLNDNKEQLRFWR